jgi:hypothetical protein
MNLISLEIRATFAFFFASTGEYRVLQEINTIPAIYNLLAGTLQEFPAGPIFSRRTTLRPELPFCNSSIARVYNRPLAFIF